MTLDEAKKILGDSIQPNGSIEELGQYMFYIPKASTICLDADFTADELEAIVVFMRANS